MVHILDTDEPMLVEEEGRSKYVIHPVRHEDMYDMATEAESALWTTGEVDTMLEQDIDDLAKMSPPLRRLVLTILAFFAASDGIVNENLGNRFMEEVKWPEARLFYAIQIGIEGIHSKMYSILLSTYVPDEVEQHRLFNAIETMPCVADKAKWALKYAQDRDLPFGVRVVAFVITEGLFFQASFCAIKYLGSLGIMPGLTFSNEKISSDENLHTKFGILTHSHLKHKPSRKVVAEMMRDALQIEGRFVDDAMPKAAIVGMNADLMKTYTRYTANRLMVKMGYGPLYHGPEEPQHHMPFSFMENQTTSTKSNFFERRVGDYKNGTSAKMSAKTLASKVGAAPATGFVIDNDF